MPSLPPAAATRPLRAIVAAGPADIDRLEALVRGVTGQAVSPGIAFTFVVPAAIRAAVQAELERVAGLPGVQASWEIDAKAAGYGETLAWIGARHPDTDFVLLAPGVELPFAWDARLRKAAYAAADIGAAVPLCDIAPMHALLDEETIAAGGRDAARLDRAAYCMGTRSFYDVPHLHPACAYLRRDALDAALPHLEGERASPQALLDALARQMRVRGWSCVLCDYLYVGFAGEAAARAPASDDIDTKAFLQHHPLEGLRRAVKDAIGHGLPALSVPGLDARPVQLHIMHFWGGGLDKWVRDFGRGDDSRVNMILASYRIGDTGGQRLVLYSDPAAMIPIRTWDIARPIRSSVSSSIEYRRILAQILEEFEVEAIIVSSLIGHSLDALTQPRKTIVVCHDFYPVCQVLNPWFGKVCERCTREDLRLCAETNPLNRFFTDQTTDEWHEMRTLYVDHLLAFGIEMVVPSASVAAELQRLDPRLRAVPTHVIPHGIDLDAAKLPFPSWAAGDRLKIAVMGRLNIHKGMELLRAAAAELRAHVEITLVGCGGAGMQLAEECGWKAIQAYEPAELPSILAALAPHAGLLASIVPETFSYTLSELQALGVPPLATALGSFAERIVDGETGILFAPDKDSLVALLRRLQVEPGRLERVARVLAALPKGPGSREMVARYHALVPLGPRPVARFAVGIGAQTALTEPYRHLTQAYGDLTGAYDRLNQAYAQSVDAYDHTKKAYEQARGEVDGWKARSQAWARELDAFGVEKKGWRWWRYPRAARLIQGLRDKIKTGD